jgi:lipopolysaccharide transport system permease protein
VGPNVGRLVELVAHLARREVAAAHRFTLLGWAWPLARQLAQLGVLVLVFSSFLDLGIPDFALFVFIGLILWNWFATGLGAASGVLLARRHLAFQPGFPMPALPAVSVAVPLVDALLAVPALVVLAAVEGELSAGLLVLVPVLAVELLLLCGLAWAVAAITVVFRDMANIVAVGLTLLFYVTPVFYDRSIVPPDLRWVLDLNPLATLIDVTRAAVVGTPTPGALRLAVVAAVALVAAAAGYAVFRRMEPRLVDEL